jgi:transposase
VAERVRVREITNQEGNRLLRMVRRSTGSVVTWRRAQMVLLSAQGMDVAQISRVTFTSPDRVRDVLHNFNLDGFGSLYPRYRGGRPPTFTLAQRRAIKQLALSRPVDHHLPFSTWSLVKLAEFLVAEGVVDDISHEGLRALLREQGVSFQRLKTWKQSTDPDFEAKKNRILHLYGLMDGTVAVQVGDPDVVICVDEFGPLNLQPHPGRLWTTRGGGGQRPRRRRRATYTARTACGTYWPPMISPATSSMGTSSRASAVASSWCSCAIYGPCTRPGCGWAWCWTTTAPLSTRDDPWVGQWAAANNVELAYTPTNASWLNRIEAQFTALRYFAVDGTDHPSHAEQSSMIRRYIAWRNHNTRDRRLGKTVNRANIA